MASESLQFFALEFPNKGTNNYAYEQFLIYVTHRWNKHTTAGLDWKKTKKKRNKKF